MVGITRAIDAFNAEDTGLKGKSQGFTDRSRSRDSSKEGESSQQLVKGKFGTVQGTVSTPDSVVAVESSTRPRVSTRSTPLPEAGNTARDKLESIAGLSVERLVGIATSEAGLGSRFGNLASVGSHYVVKTWFGCNATTTCRPITVLRPHDSTMPKTLQSLRLYLPT